MSGTGPQVLSAMSQSSGSSGGPLVQSDFPPDSRKQERTVAFGNSQAVTVLGCSSPMLMEKIDRFFFEIHLCNEIVFPKFSRVMRFSFPKFSCVLRSMIFVQNLSCVTLHTRTSKHKHSHTHTYTMTHTHTHTHSQTHAHTRSHACTHARTHTHT